MRLSFVHLLASITLVLLMTSCAGESISNSPIIPNLPDEDPPVTAQQTVDQPESNLPGHNLWNYSQVYVDPDSLKFEIIPIRNSTAHWNILTWLENGPCTDCFSIVGIAPSGTGTMLVDIEITHPFGNLNLTGFDVRGIAMFTGSLDIPSIGAKISDSTLGDGELVNADGYTALYNATTVDLPVPALQKYSKGNFSTVNFPDATINGYKIHVTDDPLNTRNAFFAGDSVIATYEVDMPDGPFVFGYAVDSSWEKATTIPVTDPIADFPMTANCADAWKITVFEQEQGSPVDRYVKLDAFEWIPGSDSTAGIAGAHWVDSDEMSFVEFDTEKSVWEITFNDPVLETEGLYKFVTWVEPSENEASPDWMDLTAYKIFTIEGGVQPKAPVAIAEADINPAMPCEEIELDGSGSYDPDGGLIVSWDWDLDDDGAFDDDSGEIISISFDSPGSFDVQLRVTDDEGAIDTLDEPIEISVVNSLPTAVADADLEYIFPGGEVEFDATESHDNDCDGAEIVEWKWDLDDDGTYEESGSIVSRIFSEEGDFNVMCKVQDDEGEWDFLDEPIVIHVVIEEMDPIAHAICDPNPATKCAPFTIMDDGSYDPDGGEIQLYEWDIDNDGTWDLTGENQPFDGFPMVGSMFVNLRVTDDEGNTGTLEEPLEIIFENGAPVAVAESDDTEADKYDYILFDATDSYDSDCGGDSIVEVAWDWENDGTWDYFGETKYHSYSQAGEYEVQCRVKDDEGEFDILDTPIIITILVGPLPTAHANASPLSVAVCEPVDFFDTGSYGGGELLIWAAYDFDNDGTWDEEDGGPFDTQYTWYEPGFYYVQYGVANNVGNQDMLDEPIQVFVFNISPQAEFITDLEKTWIGNSVFYDAEGSYDQDCDNESIVLYEWDWDSDGEYDDTGETQSHTWNTPGNYDVTLRVTDNEGGTDLSPAQTMVVTGLPYPTAVLQSNDDTPNICEVIGFSDGGSDGGGWPIITYRYDWDNNGSWDYSSSSSIVDHSWFDTGTYYVQYQVTNSVGWVDELDTPFQLIIGHKNPTAVAWLSQSQVLTGTKITFDGSDSYDNDCSGDTIVTYEWDFDGDGTYDMTGNVVDHDYDSPGLYNVQLRVWDDEGAWDILDIPHVVTVYDGYAHSWGSTGNDTAECIAHDSIYNIYTVGQFSGTVDFDPGTPVVNRTSNGQTDAYLVKYNYKGEFQWVKTWGGTGSDYATGVTAYGNDYVMICGYFENSVNFDPDGSLVRSSNGETDCYISRFDKDGDFIFNGTWGGSGLDWASGITLDNGVYAYITGGFEGVVDFNPWTGKTFLTSNGDLDAYVVKLGGSGTFSWAKSWGSSDYDSGMAISRAGSKISVAGYYQGNLDFNTGAGFYWKTSTGLKDIFLSQFTNAGEWEWTRAVGGTGQDIANGVHAETNGSQYIYLTGDFNGTVDFNPGTSSDYIASNGGSDAYLSRYNTSGTYLGTETWGSFSDDSAQGVSGDLLGTVVGVTGDFRNSCDFDPGSGGAWRTSVGDRDAYLNVFDNNLIQQWVTSWGSTSIDVNNSCTIDINKNFYSVGYFNGTADFDDGSGVYNLSSNGFGDAFMVMYPEDGSW